MSGRIGRLGLSIRYRWTVIVLVLFVYVIGMYIGIYILLKGLGVVIILMV